MEINVVNTPPDTIKVSVTAPPTIKVSAPTVRTVSAIIPQGPKGDQGPAGPAGADGQPGANGNDGSDGSTQYGVVSAEPTTAADFTFDGIDHDIVFDNSATSGVAYMYGLNSASTGIYRWSGSRSTILILEVTNFRLENSAGSTINTGTTYEIGASTNIWQANCEGFNATLRNVAGGTLSGTNEISVTNISATQTWGSSNLTIETSDLSGAAPNQTLVDFRDGTAKADFDVYYPNDTSWSSGQKTLEFDIDVADGSNTDDAKLTFKFRNRVFHGGSSNATLTSEQIIALDNSPFTGSNFTLSSTSVSTTGTEYYYYCYPSRFSGDPTFFIGGFDTPFTELSDVSVTNSSGYVETYKVYQSPEQYTDATFTLQVTT